MDKFNRVVSYKTQEYGKIQVKLSQMLKDKGITRNYLRTLTGVKYDVIDRYYRAENIEMVDINFLAKVCFALNCKIEDLLEYQRPKEK